MSLLASPTFRRLAGKLPFKPFRNLPPVVPVVRLAGVIAGVSTPLGTRVINLATLAPQLEHAFSAAGAAAVALAINSPGGSPVQSALLHTRIRELAAEKKLPVFAFAEDVAASGGYWLALAGDEIFADQTSIVGSIGVISAGFGFSDLLARIGVERRLHTEGTRKSLLDPFRPEKPEDIERLRRLQQEIHQRFIELVRERRGAKLKDPEANGVFEGEIFTGQGALEIGLIDGIGHLRTVMRARFGDKVQLRGFGAPRSWLRRRLGLAEARGGDWAEGLLAAAEKRAVWERYGL